MNKPADALQERQKYVRAFNSTMVKIWKEKIVLTNAIDTGALYNSVIGVSMSVDGKFLDVSLSQAFNAYGIYVNYGVGGEIKRGNPGDIGHPKVRKAKRWFDKKYYQSVMNIRDFYADNTGREGAWVICEALNVDSLRRYAASL